jgi:hypothetical protein
LSLSKQTVMSRLTPSSVELPSFKFGVGLLQNFEGSEMRWRYVALLTAVINTYNTHVRSGIRLSNSRVQTAISSDCMHTFDTHDYICRLKCSNIAIGLAFKRGYYSFIRDEVREHITNGGGGGGLRYLFRMLTFCEKVLGRNYHGLDQEILTRLC